MLHQDEGGIGKSIPDAQEGEARGKSRGSREIWRAEGMDFPIPPEFWWSTDNLSASIFLQGVDQKILPCGQGRIDCIKINPSLLMMRECQMQAHYVVLILKDLPQVLSLLQTTLTTIHTTIGRHRH